MSQAELVQITTWVIIGGLAGVIVGMLVRRQRRGFGLVGNVIIGLVGAIVGGFLFDQLGINVLGNVTISLNDLLAAIVGSLILLVVLSFVKRA